jgi:hypothetical protein
MIDMLSSFWDYYVALARDHWNHMTPIKYGFLLIFVFACGFLLLRSGIKRT